MKTTADKFHQELEEAILKDNGKTKSIVSVRREWINSYSGKEKDEIILYVLKKDEELKKLIEDKMKVVKDLLLTEEELERNRRAFKLYE